MSIKNHKWSDDDLSLDELGFVGNEKIVWFIVDDMHTINLELSDVKALAAHFELDVDHKAALAEKEAELEKARELLKRVQGEMHELEQLDCPETVEPDEVLMGEIAAYLGDKA